MDPTGKFPLRFALYSVAIVYLLGDLLVFKGPIRHRIDLANPDSPAAIAAAKAKGVVARVSGRPISRSQLDRALAERLWLDGRSAGGLTPVDLATARHAALEELIDQELLRLQVRALAPQLSVGDAEIDERLRRLVGRFETKGALETAMKTQGITTEQDLRNRLAARIRQEKLIALRIGPFIKVTDQEALEWFGKNQQSVSLPERIEVRHIFIPTLDHPPEEAKQKLDTALAELTEKKKDFATLAKETSEDPATRDNGGSLGWMTRDRLPADFAAPVFSLGTNQPSLVRTRLGWHLVEITARKPAEPRTFEQAKPGILSALEAVKRREATENLRKSLRKPGTVKIEILQDA
ncbi:MAG: peptidylprolyl isomerase [Verrucomicrobiota bacterium]